jgi:hypothetical protein
MLSVNLVKINIQILFDRVIEIDKLLATFSETFVER